MEEIFNAKKTSIIMMQDRGYEISAQELSLLDLDEIPQRFDDRIQLIKSLAADYKHSSLLEITVLRFASAYEGESQSVSSKSIKQYITDIKKMRDSYPNFKINFVLVGDTPSTSVIRKAMDEVGADGWQYFELNQMQSSPATHVFQPRYIRLSPSEAEAKIEELKIRDRGLNWMLETSPIARWYWYKPGDLILVLRDYEAIEGFAPIRPNYRIVVRSE